MHLNNFMVNLDFSVFTFWKISKIEFIKVFKVLLVIVLLSLKDRQRFFKFSNSQNKIIFVVVEEIIGNFVSPVYFFINKTNNSRPGQAGGGRIIPIIVIMSLRPRPTLLQHIMIRRTSLTTQGIGLQEQERRHLFIQTISGAAWP